MWSAVDLDSSAAAAAAAPSARGKHAAALLGGHVYVLGGRGAGGAVPLRDFWRYSLASGRWERLPLTQGGRGDGGEAPPALQEHSAVPHGDRLYVFGGEVGALAGETPLWVYHTQTGVWRKLPGAPAAPSSRRTRARAGGGGKDPGATQGAAQGSTPRARRGHSAHALNDCMLVYGGYTDLRGSTNELWAFHYESESWQAVRTRGAAGPARHRHAAALHGARLYVHGGQSGLRECADLWHYDTLSREWRLVRTGGPGPGARSGHAGLRAGAHFYIYGGETAGHPTNELWRFHFATETWERIHAAATCWPSPRVDCRVLLAPPLRAARPPPRAVPPPAPASAPPPPRARPDPPQSIFREISKLSGFHRRAARCSYSMLAPTQDSTESLPHLAKSHSAYVMDAGGSPREGDEADTAGPTALLSPTRAAKLVYLDSDEEEELRRERRELALIRRSEGRPPATTPVWPPAAAAGWPRAVVALPKSASVRFSKEPAPTPVTTKVEDEGELSTSDYASAERVNRLSGTSSLGFCNPHYLGPDVRALGAALTPDSGVAGDIELQELGTRPAPPAVPAAPGSAPPPRLHLLLVGGREPSHLALLQRPLSMWTYRLL